MTFSAIQMRFNKKKSTKIESLRCAIARPSEGYNNFDIQMLLDDASKAKLIVLRYLQIFQLYSREQKPKEAAKNNRNVPCTKANPPKVHKILS